MIPLSSQRILNRISAEDIRNNHVPLIVLNLIKKTFQDMPESQLLLYFYLISFILVFIQSNRDGSIVFDESDSSDDSSVSTVLTTQPGIESNEDEPELIRLPDHPCMSVESLHSLTEYYDRMGFKYRSLLMLPIDLIQNGVEEAAQFFFPLIWNSKLNQTTSNQNDLMYTVFLVLIRRKIYK